MTYFDSSSGSPMQIMVLEHMLEISFLNHLQSEVGSKCQECRSKPSNAQIYKYISIYVCILIKSSKKDHKHYLPDFINGKANILNQCSSVIMMRTVDCKN